MGGTTKAIREELRRNAFSGDICVGVILSEKHRRNCALLAEIAEKTNATTVFEAVASRIPIDDRYSKVHLTSICNVWCPDHVLSQYVHAGADDLEAAYVAEAALRVLKKKSRNLIM